MSNRKDLETALREFLAEQMAHSEALLDLCTPQSPLWRRELFAYMRVLDFIEDYKSEMVTEFIYGVEPYDANYVVWRAPKDRPLLRRYQSNLYSGWSGIDWAIIRSYDDAMLIAETLNKEVA